MAEGDRHVGKIYSKSSSFLDYVRKSLKKLGLDESKLPEKLIMDYYEKYQPRMNELEAFNMLKVVLAPCIETLILLDRLCYLKEQVNYVIFKCITNTFIKSSNMDPLISRSSVHIKLRIKT